VIRTHTEVKIRRSDVFYVCTYRARELGINWTGSRYELIPRIQAELKNQAEVKNEHEKHQRQLAQNKYLREEKKRREQERLDGMNAQNPPKFGLTGARRPLRPEFVRSYEHALNSDVHCTWDTAISSHKGDRMQVEKATEYYSTSVISQLAVELHHRYRLCSPNARAHTDPQIYQSTSHDPLLYAITTDHLS
jgi:hypothetical protein